ncbi:hypothetical protein [Lysinibacillus sphaericus]|uniref:hypothetical protein n=1 Tax=Lysinibacillus sphaericus TaxID=1421 RepID=UPI001CBCF107|nr:hypothetical protein [Lysinibacillus sphaericus]
MKSIDRKVLIGKSFGVVFILLGIFTYKGINLQNGSLFENISLLWFTYVFIYFGIILLIPQWIEKYKILSFLFSKILILPIVILIYYQYLFAPFMAIIMYISIFIIPPLLVNLLSENIPIFNIYQEGLIYLLSLITVLLFAYNSNTLMRFINSTLKTKFLKKLLEQYTDTNYTRIFTYTIMIGIYITYNFLSFANIKFTLVPNEMLNVIKEVFVTFVAIDTLLQILISKRGWDKKKKC